MRNELSERTRLRGRFEEIVRFRHQLGGFEQVALDRGVTANRLAGQRQLLARWWRRLRRGGDDDKGGERDGEAESDSEFHAAMVRARHPPLKCVAADRARRAAIGTRGGNVTAHAASKVAVTMRPEQALRGEEP